MGGLLGEGSIFSSLGSTQGAVTAAICALLLLCGMSIVYITKLPFTDFAMSFFRWVMKFFGKAINAREEKYHRDLAIGKIDSKRRRVKMYRFLSDLIIDLQMKGTGITPYEFLFIIAISSLICTAMACRILFGGFGMTVLMFPIVTVGVICTLYTRANIAHDARIEAVIEAENIICNNIHDGVIVAVKNSLDVMPKEVRESFRDFVDNVEHKNYHIRTALMELNMHLGAIADDFIKKCIVFELEEEHGIANMFRDIVELNNIKMELRTEMKRRFEAVVSEFKAGAFMIFVFLAGVLVIYKDVAHFYLKTPLGQLIIAIDILILIAEYVYITYLRAKEL